MVDCPTYSPNYRTSIVGLRIKLSHWTTIFCLLALTYSAVFIVGYSVDSKISIRLFNIFVLSGFPNLKRQFARILIFSY